MPELEKLQTAFKKHLIKEFSFENAIGLAFIRKFESEADNPVRALRVAKVFVNTIIGFNEGDELIFFDDYIINNLRNIFSGERSLDGISKLLLSKINSVRNNQFILNEFDIMDIETEINYLCLEKIYLNHDKIDFVKVSEHIMQAKLEIDSSLNNSFIRFQDSKNFKEIIKRPRLERSFLEITDYTQFLDYFSKVTG